MRDELDGISLLDQIAPSARSALTAAARPVHLTAGERLFSRGDPPGPMFVVRSGRLQAVDETTGETLRTMGHGAVIGELSIVTGEPRSATVVASRDSALLAIPHAAVEAALDAEPSLGLTLLRSVSMRLRTGADPATAGRTTPATIAVLDDDGAAPMGPASVLLHRALAAAGPVELIRRPADDDLTAAAERIDGLERAGSRVVLLAGTGDDGWAAFCARQADAIVRVATDRGPDADPTRPGRPADHLLRPGPDLDDRVALLARRLTGRSVGVVLSGGGARGFAHIGALEALLDAGVIIDRVGGCSSGALVGALFAAGRAPEEIARVCRAELVEHNPLRDYTVPLVSLIRGQDVRDMLVRCFGEATIESLPRDYFCVSVDLVASALVVHRAGLVHRAVGASMSLPGIGPPVADGERLLVDGGVLDNLPVATMAATAEGPVVAIDVSAPFAPPAGDGSSTPGTGRPRAVATRDRLRAAVVGDAGGEHGRLPSLRETLMRAVTLGAANEAAAAARYASLTIRPPVRDVGLFAFGRLDELRARGRDAAREALAAAPGWADGPR